MKKYLLLTTLLMSSAPLMALSDNNQIATKAGKLTMIKKFSDERYPAKILLNGKMIKGFSERPLADFEKKFKGTKSDLVFVRCNYGGSHTSDDFLVIELFKNGKYKVSPIVASCNGEYKIIKQDEGFLKVDFGRCEGKHKRATYRNGSFR